MKGLEIDALKQEAMRIRRTILDIAFNAKTPTHIGPALSCADIITVLYNRIMRVNHEKPEWDERDRFIMSKGHACLALYASLAQANFISWDLLDTVRKLNSPLEGHPVMNTKLGIDFSAGSLGNGLAAGLGMAYYLKYNKRDSKVFVLLGDGECQEGVVWEAALTAAALKVSNLIAIVDNNKYQSSGATKDIVSMDSMKEKWKSMNWNALEINGHSVEEIVKALELSIKFGNGPTVIIANTIKGKGVSFMENDNSWHQKYLEHDKYVAAMKELA